MAITFNGHGHLDLLQAKWFNVYNLIMQSSFDKILKGYKKFRQKYSNQNNSLMRKLSVHGQKPQFMLISCCDSRVDPALLLQCEPGDLFITRNVANIVPPYECDDSHHGTSAALEFGVCYLEIKHLIILGHSQCGGINALLNKEGLHQDDFISNWVGLINISDELPDEVDHCAKASLISSYQNCLTFPWIREKLASNELSIHLWFFDIKEGIVYTCDADTNQFTPL